MKLKPLAKIITAALTAGALIGCTDVDPINNTTDPVTPPATSPLADSIWTIGEPTRSASLQDVYTFDGSEQCFYTEDVADPTKYAAPKCEGYEDDLEGTFTFTYYGAVEAGQTIEADYSVDNSALAIETKTVDGVEEVMSLTGEDKSEDETIKNAVDASNEASGNVNNYAVKITDTMGSSTDDKNSCDIGGKCDTGELRIKFADSGIESIESGKLTATVTYQLGDPVEGQNAKSQSDNAYITLWSTDTSSDYVHGEAIFECTRGTEVGEDHGNGVAELCDFEAEGEGVVKYRDADKQMQSTNNTFKIGEPIEVEITWDLDTYSFTVDGEAIISDEPVRDKTAVTALAVRLGDDRGTTPYQVVVDKLKIYSNDSDEEVEVFADDFNSRTAGQTLNSNPYNNNSNEAVVFDKDGSGTDTTDPDGGDGGTDTTDPDGTTDEPSGQYVEITNTLTKEDDTENGKGDTGELRYVFENSQEKGMAEAYLKWNPNTNTEKSATIGIYDSTNSTDAVIADLRISTSGKVTLRDLGDELTTIDIGEWVKFNISWDVVDGDYDNQSFTVFIDDQKYGPYTRNNIKGKGDSCGFDAGDDADTGDDDKTDNRCTSPATGIAIKLGDNSTAVDSTLLVDNLKVYSDVEGTQEVHSDDFEGHAVGLDLGAGEGGYNSNGFEAVVKE